MRLFILLYLIITTISRLCKIKFSCQGEVLFHFKGYVLLLIADFSAIAVCDDWSGIGPLKTWAQWFTSFIFFERNPDLKIETSINYAYTKKKQKKSQGDHDKEFKLAIRNFFSPSEQG